MPPPGASGKRPFSHDVGLPLVIRDTDRFMLCSSPAMLADMRAVLAKLDLDEGNMSWPCHSVIERGFVDQ